MHCSMRLDFGLPPEDEPRDKRFAEAMARLHAELDAAVEREDYAEAQRVKVVMDAAVETRQDEKLAAAAAATFCVDDEKGSEAGFRYDTPTSRSATLLQSSNAMAGTVPVDNEWTPELSSLVLRQLAGAFDNYPLAEVEGMLEALVEASSSQVSEAEETLRKLAGLSRQMEALEAAAARGAGAIEYLEDEARALRSQIRIWGKDAEKYARGR